MEWIVLTIAFVTIFILLGFIMHPKRTITKNGKSMFAVIIILLISRVYFIVFTPTGTGLHQYYDETILYREFILSIGIFLLSTLVIKK